MKLQQNQVWQKGGRYFRIVHLERLSVDYKLMPDLTSKEGEHLRSTKKEFCRLLRGASLVEG